MLTAARENATPNSVTLLAPCVGQEACAQMVLPNKVPTGDSNTGPHAPSDLYPCGLAIPAHSCAGKHSFFICLVFIDVVRL